jgi:hypothetical protein
LPAVQAAREAARRAQCVNNLKQLALAAANYESSNKRYPPAGLSGYFEDYATKFVHNGPSAFVAITPHLDQTPLYNAYNFSVSWRTGANVTVARTGIGTLWCPSDPAALEPGPLDSVFFTTSYPAPSNTSFKQFHNSYSGCIGIHYADYFPSTLNDPCLAPWVASAQGVLIQNGAVTLS